jgi:DnaJ-domain-containing protein 1
MSATELVTVTVGLVVGYWIISRWMSTRIPRPAEPNDAAPGPNQSGQPADGPDGHDQEWIRANWHEILGVSPRASIEVIKSAYRLRAQQYDPDRTEGLGPELRDLAVRKMQELNLAYAWATRSHRGRWPA